MKVGIFFVGILAALFAAVVLMFTVGQGVAIVAIVVVLAATVYGMLASREVGRWLLGGLAAVLVVSLVVGGWGAFQIVQALTDTDGPVDPADPVALASARAKVTDARSAAGFSIELTEIEMTAYLLNALADNPDNPLRNVTLDVVDGAPGQQGLVEFEAEFKGGSVDASGAVSATLVNGSVKIEIEKVDLGAFSVPGLAKGAIEDLIESIADLNDALASAGADIQALEIGDDRVLVVGTTTSTDLLTSEALLSSLADQAAAVAGAVTPPQERLGPGVVNSTSAGSAPFYVALGDSLAANIGVAEARDGYVSRLHNQLQIADGRQYGLRNFGISGETTGTMIRSGQLDDAVAFMEGAEVAYVTIDIGANNLLGHLGSDDCSESLAAPACAARIEDAKEGYDDDLIVIFDAINEAAPGATVVFMQAYNPFSFGFADAVEFERDSDRILAEFNAIAAGVATDRGIVIADAFTPMQGTTGATTHMLDPEPDIHPTPIGFDILAGAILDAL